MRENLKTKTNKKRFKAIIIMVIVFIFISTLMVGYTGAWFMTDHNVTIERIVKIQ